MDMVVEKDTSRKLAAVVPAQNSTLNLEDRNATQDRLDKVRAHNGSR